MELRKVAMDSFARPAGRLAPALLLAAGLAGCNGSTAQLAYASAKPYSPEWCEAAKTIATENYSGSHLFAVGRCHEVGVAGFPKDENLYVFYYTQSARWGNLQGGEALARLGRPVPANDLELAHQERAAARRNTETLAAAIRGPNPQRQNTWPGQPSVNAARPSPPLVSFPSRSFSQTQSSSSTSTRTVCNNGVCTTTNQ
ncbi:hypothetical protein [Bosea thiooxidans]